MPVQSDMTRVLLVLLQLVLLPAVTLSVCDGNPHKWGRLRRCDQRAAGCPDAPWAGPKLCEGIGGLASSRAQNPHVGVSVEPPALVRDQFGPGWRADYIL